MARFGIRIGPFWASTSTSSRRRAPAGPPVGLYLVLAGLAIAAAIRWPWLLAVAAALVLVALLGPRLRAGWAELRSGLATVADLARVEQPSAAPGPPAELCECGGLYTHLGGCSHGRPGDRR